MFYNPYFLDLLESHGEEEEDAEDDEDDDEGDDAEEAGEENDRPYNLRQRKTVQRYEAPPIGTCIFYSHTLYSVRVSSFLLVTASGLICHNQELCVCFLRACEQTADQCFTFWHS